MKFIFFLFLFLTALFAEEGDITLEQVINLSKKTSFEQKNILYEIQKSDTSLKQTDQNYYPNIYLDTQLGREQNLEKNENVSMNDSFAYIVWKNNLYDSTDSLVKSNLIDTKKLQELKLQESFQKRKIVAMQYFFDVKLTVMYHQYILEVLAMDAIQKNRLKDVQDVGRTSDIALLESEAAMQHSSAKNYKAQQEIFIQKQKLTNFLGLDFYKVKSFVTPNLDKYLTKIIPEADQLKQLAYKHDPTILKLNQKITTVQNEIGSINRDYHFKLTSTVMYGKEDQKTVDISDNRYEARLSFQVPLYDAGGDSNKVETLRIEKMRLKNKLDEYKQALALKIDQLVVELGYKKRMIKAASTNLDFRNLYLDKARVLYDQDRASDLGDSMTLLSKAEYEYAKAKYEYVMAYENLNLLTGVENETK